MRLKRKTPPYIYGWKTFKRPLTRMFMRRIPNRYPKSAQQRVLGGSFNQFSTTRETVLYRDSKLHQMEEADKKVKIQPIKQEDEDSDEECFRGTQVERLENQEDKQVLVDPQYTGVVKPFNEDDKDNDEECEIESEEETSMI